MSQHDATKNDPTASTDGSTDKSTDETTTIETFLDEGQGSQPYQGQQGIYAATNGAFAGTAPTYKSGPAPTTSVFGLLGLLTAIAVVLSKSTDLDIPWGVVGPVAVVGAGVLLVVLGLAGLRGQRFRG